MRTKATFLIQIFCPKYDASLYHLIQCLHVCTEWQWLHSLN